MTTGKVLIQITFQELGLLGSSYELRQPKQMKTKHADKVLTHIEERHLKKLVLEHQVR